MVSSKMESNSTGANKNRGTRNLQYPGNIQRREEGRCFHCSGPYNPSHKCPDKNIKVLIMVENEEEVEGEEEKEMELTGFSAWGLT